MSTRKRILQIVSNGISKDKRDKVEPWILSLETRRYLKHKYQDSSHQSTRYIAKKGCACESDSCANRCFVSFGKSCFNLVKNGQNYCTADAVCKEIED